MGTGSGRGKWRIMAGNGKRRERGAKTEAEAEEKTEGGKETEREGGKDKNFIILQMKF